MGIFTCRQENDFKINFKKRKSNVELWWYIPTYIPASPFQYIQMRPPAFTALVFQLIPTAIVIQCTMTAFALYFHNGCISCCTTLHTFYTYTDWRADYVCVISLSQRPQQSGVCLSVWVALCCGVVWLKWNFYNKSLNFIVLRLADWLTWRMWYRRWVLIYEWSEIESAENEMNSECSK